MKKFLLMAGMVFLFVSISLSGGFAESNGLGNGIYAVFETSKGEIIASLEYRKVPLTVMNFIGLAEGTLPFKNRNGKYFYDGMIFHRVVPNFIIQSGDPLGNGSGGPGYMFPNETRSDLKHDKAGVLAMANRGPDTNGSQFYITMRPAPWLDGYFSVFGHVVKGMDVVTSIAQGDELKSVRIVRIGSDAKKFKVSKARFDKLVLERKKEEEKLALEKRKRDIALIEKKWPKAIKTDSGLMYIVLKEGAGKSSPKADTEVTVNYEGEFLDGKIFDSSYKRGKPATFKVGQVIPGWSEALMSMKKGEKRLLIIPPELAYGKMGYPGVIPPNSFLVFTVELLDF